MVGEDPRGLAALTIAPADPDNPQVRALVALHLGGMHANSPPQHVHALDLSGLQGPDIVFLAAWASDRLAGMGAVKRLGGDAAELKSMRTHPDFLRRGVAAAILKALLAQARAWGVAEVLLETGTGPSFEPALTLYKAHGFVQRGPFADYTANDFSVFYGLVVTD